MRSFLTAARPHPRIGDLIIAIENAILSIRITEKGDGIHQKVELLVTKYRTLA